MASLAARVERLSLVALVALASTHAHELAAQSVTKDIAYDSINSDSLAEWMRLPHPLPQCIASIPPDSMTRTPIFLHASLSDTTLSALTLQADLMAQDVAKQMIALLGGTSDALPTGDPTVTWSSVPAELIVTAHQDGSVTHRGVSRSGDTTATTLLTNAFDAARKAGDALMVWPDNYAPRSLVVRLVLLPASVARDGRPRVPRLGRSQFGVFVVPEPTESPALARMGNPSPHYPISAEHERVTATVLLQFVVDTLGRAEPATIRDLWPSDKPRPTGYRAKYYQEFVESTEEAVRMWQFYPARVGPCPVNQIVQQPIVFVGPHHRS